jgi:hypothetical protein
MVHTSTSRVLKLTPELLHALSSELGWLLTMEGPLHERIATLADPAEVEAASTSSRSLLKGSLLIYLFALWQSHMPHDFKTWMTLDERLEFEAYEHVRDSVAHAVRGGRANHERKRLAFERRYPFAGVKWILSEDTLDLADSTIVQEFLNFMMGMSAQIAARMSVGTRPNAA